MHGRVELISFALEESVRYSQRPIGNWQVAAAERE
jgi:hypothetical protein